MSSRIRTDAALINQSQITVPSAGGYTHRVYERTPTEDKFKETQWEDIDTDEYLREGSDPGLVIIFNQVNFRTQLTRVGSDKDVMELINTFGKLGFNIEEEFIYTDETRAGILNNIKAICAEKNTKNLKSRNCLICVFLSHGGADNTLHASDCVLNVNEIITPFAQCKALENKPKFFIFQACKVKQSSTNEVQFVPNETFYNVYDDVLVAYATLEGNPAFRDEDNGTWYIQELCKNMLAYGKRDDAVRLIMRTSKCVTKNCYYQEYDKYEKQVPIFVSTLSKKFYLTKSKDRAGVLERRRRNEELKNAMKELQKRVEQIHVN